MGQTVHHKLLVRLVALAAVSFSLVLVLRQDDQIGLGMAQSMPVFQPQAPIIVARNEPGSPLVISAEPTGLPWLSARRKERFEIELLKEVGR